MNKPKVGSGELQELSNGAQIITLDPVKKQLVIRSFPVEDAGESRLTKFKQELFYSDGHFKGGLPHVRTACDPRDADRWEDRSQRSSQESGLVNFAISLLVNQD